jgi:hypothetical protein
MFDTVLMSGDSEAYTDPPYIRDVQYNPKIDHTKTSKYPLAQNTDSKRKLSRACIPFQERGELFHHNAIHKRESRTDFIRGISVMRKKRVNVWRHHSAIAQKSIPLLQTPSPTNDLEKRYKR